MQIPCIQFKYNSYRIQIFKGKLHHVCQDLETATLTDPIRACRSKADTQCGSTAICVGNWTGPNFGMTSFDNIGYSLLTVFQVITLEDWIIAYYHVCMLEIKISKIGCREGENKENCETFFKILHYL